MQVAVQQRVAGADNADEADDGDEAFVPGTTAEADGEDSDGAAFVYFGKSDAEQVGSREDFSIK